MAESKLFSYINTKTNETNSVICNKCKPDVEPSFKSTNLFPSEPNSSISFFADDDFFLQSGDSSENYGLYLKANYQQFRGDTDGAARTSQMLVDKGAPVAAFDVRVNNLFETGQFKELIKLPMFEKIKRDKVEWETMMLGARAHDSLNNREQADELFKYLEERESDRDQIAYFDVMRLLKSGRIKDSIDRIESFLKVSTLKPRHAMFYQLKAAALMQPPKVDYAGALESITKSVELNHRSEKGWQTKAALHERLGQPEEALKAISTLVSITNNQDLRKALVERLFKANKFEQAATELEKVAEETEAHYFDLALLYWKNKQNDKSLENLKKSIKINPGFSKARLLSLEILLSQKNKPEITKMFTEWLSASNVLDEPIKSLLALTNYGFYPSELAVILERLETKHHKDPRIVSAMADLFFIEKKYLKAVEKYKILISLLTANKKMLARAFYQVGYCYNELKNSEQAVLALQQAISADSKFAESFNLISYIYLKNGNALDQALEFAEKALKLERNTVAFFDTKAMILIKMKKFDLAKKTLVRALDIDPKNSELKKRMAEIGLMQH
jgi:tetratricopeptide (TPR) repeat protein